MKMKTTQINGSTFIHSGDLVAWLRKLAATYREMSSEPIVRVSKTSNAIADNLEKWSTDSERQRGVPNQVMPVVKGDQVDG
jgi:hypothetical protein